MNIVLVGIQGSGKGTQARLIKEKFSYSFFEMGQKLRNFAEIGHPDSLVVKKALTEGSLVTLEMSGKILAHYRETHQDNFILFDGIPRNLDQKEMFDMIIDEYCVFFLELDKETAIKRLSGRRIDPMTGESFGPDFVSDINPSTGNLLITRSDDTPEAVKKRVEIFLENTMPLLNAWKHEGRKIYSIDASYSVEKVFEQIDDIIENKFYSVVD